MFPAKGALGERVFLSSDVSRMAGISLRQLQWWDERKVVSPRKEDHRRFYIPEQVLEILAVAALRAKGMSLQKIRRVLRMLRNDLSRRSPAFGPRTRLYAITDGAALWVEDDTDAALQRISEARRPVYLVSLGELARRIVSAAPRRFSTRQLQLF
jgi:DNA-binding transcriptional MerR regulator